MKANAGNAGWETSIKAASRTAASMHGVNAIEVENAVRAELADYRPADVTQAFIAKAAVDVAGEVAATIGFR